MSWSDISSVATAAQVVVGAFFYRECFTVFFVLIALVLLSIEMDPGFPKLTTVVASLVVAGFTILPVDVGEIESLIIL